MWVENFESQAYVPEQTDNFQELLGFFEWQEIDTLDFEDFYNSMPNEFLSEEDKNDFISLCNQWKNNPDFLELLETDWFPVDIDSYNGFKDFALNLWIITWENTKEASYSDSLQQTTEEVEQTTEDVEKSMKEFNIIKDILNSKYSNDIISNWNKLSELLKEAENNANLNKFYLKNFLNI